MKTLDLIPRLRHRGNSIVKSGARLAADLQSAREGINRLNDIFSNEVLSERTYEVDIARKTLQDVLTAIDGVDPVAPPTQEKLDFLSQRVRLATSMIQLVLNQEAISILTQNLNGQGYSAQEM